MTGATLLRADWLAALDSISWSHGGTYATDGGPLTPWVAFRMARRGFVRRTGSALTHDSRKGRPADAPYVSCWRVVHKYERTQAGRVALRAARARGAL
jgi:hypothetical protein